MLVYVRPRYVKQVMESIRKSMTRTTQSKEGKWSWLTSSGQNKASNDASSDIKAFGSRQTPGQQPNESSTQQDKTNNSSSNNHNNENEEEKREE